MHNNDLTRGQRAAETVASTVGSWRFIIAQAVVMGIWVLLNSLQATHTIHFDTFPFVFLNLAMSAEAAFASPVLLIAANVAAARSQQQTDRIEALTEQSARSGEHMEHLATRIDDLAEGMATLLQADHVEHGRMLRDLHAHTVCDGHTVIISPNDAAEDTAQPNAQESPA